MYIVDDVVVGINSTQPVNPGLEIKYVPDNGAYVAGIEFTLNSIKESQQLLNEATIGTNEGVTVGVGVGVGLGSTH